MHVLIVGRNESEAAALARLVVRLGHTPTIEPRHAQAVATRDARLARWLAVESARPLPTLPGCGPRPTVRD